MHRIAPFNKRNIFIWKSVNIYLCLKTHLIDSPSLSQGANPSHIGSSSPAAVKTISSDKKRKLCLKKKDAGAPRTQENPLKYSNSREEVNRVAFLLDEVFPILHELPQRHHGVVVDVELVVS